MRFRLYQIDRDKDPNRKRFEPFDRTDTVDPSIYRKVFDAEADVTDLEDAYATFNIEGHPLLNGYSMTVSDVIVNEDGAFYVDSDGFTKIEFDETKVDTSDQIRVLFVQPHEKPFVAEIPDTLKAKQNAVGGLIEFVYNSDETALVCDEEAKLKNKEGNRYLDGGGIIAGNFLVVGLGEEDCRSLTDEEIQKYSDKYSEAPDITDEETSADVGFKFYGFM